MSFNNQINWMAVEDKINIEEFQAVQEQLGVIFPEDYRECILKYNGGCPKPSSYDFNGYKGKVFGFLLSYNQESSIYILDVYNRNKKSIT